MDSLASLDDTQLIEFDAEICEVENRTDESCDHYHTNENIKVDDLSDLVLPQSYCEIYESYKNKEFRDCLMLLENVKTDFVQYRIIRSACLIHLDEEDCLREAHKILDETLEYNNKNAYAWYAKGLALYREMKWENCLTFLEKAMMLDPENMERAEVLRDRAQDKIDEKQKINKSYTAMVARKFEGDEITRRFGCEICGNFFGKKYNLDRHNRAIHRRNTPTHYPTMSVDVTSDDIRFQSNNKVIKSPSSLAVENQTPKKRKAEDEEPARGKDKKAKCKICRKTYKRNSIARHLIIHTGLKQFQCSTCDRGFFQKSDLIRHETIHSDLMAFECKSCEKRFRIKKNLQVHLKRHHSNRVCSP